MSTLSRIPEVSTEARSAWLDDMAAIEAEIVARSGDEIPDAEIEAINRYDATHCRCCGAVTAGTDIAGSHVQACDACIVQYVQENLGAVVA